MRKILKIARKYVDNIAFLSCGPVDDSRTDPWIYDETQRYSSKSYEKYSAIIKEFCEDNKVLFIDVYNPLKKSKEDVLDEEDGLHLNDIGHKIVAKVVEKAIVKAGFVKP